jgi:hypothetical protein
MKIGVVKGRFQPGSSGFTSLGTSPLNEYEIMPVDVTKKSVSTAARERRVLE